MSFSTLADEWFTDFITRCQTPEKRRKVLAERLPVEEHVSKSDALRAARRRRETAVADDLYPFNSIHVTTLEVRQWARWRDEGMKQWEIAWRAGVSEACVSKHLKKTNETERQAA